MILDSIFHFSLLVGVILSFLLSMYIYFVPPKSPSNITLGSLILVWTTTVFIYVFKSDEFFINHPHLYSLIDPVVLLFFPLMYLYIKFFFIPTSKISYKISFHFLPILIYLIVFSPFLILSSDQKLDHLINGLPEWFLSYSLVFDLIIIIQGIIYSLKSFKILYQFNDYSSITKELQLSVRFMKFFMFSNILLWAVGTAGVVLQILEVKVTVNFFHFFYFGLTFLMMTIGFCAFKWPRLFLQLETENINKEAPSKELLFDETPIISSINDHSSTDSQVLLGIIETKKPYLKNDLKMQDLVEISDFSYKKISQMLNNDLNTSFYELMNDFRLKEVMRLIDEGKHIQYTLPHIGEQAGFNSKTTFNRTFKQKIGQTPSEYIKTLEKVTSIDK